MLLVGLTGGIGSGKSTVARMLEARGAVVFDADEFARQAIAAGTPGFRRVVETFGRRVVGEDGEIDRARLASIVFDDPDDRLRLEAIVHPEVGRLLQQSVEPLRGTGEVVVYAVPLLVENHLEPMFDVVAVVTAPEDVRLARLVRRGMGEDDARARLRAQLTDAERVAVAHEVVANDGSEPELEARVARLWAGLRARAAAGPAPGAGPAPAEG
ncbi:MAG TPA: dephospho-CoA kinase [Actinomycetota bacterium]|jgi:dephospho-CoA kinase